MPLANKAGPVKQYRVKGITSLQWVPKWETRSSLIGATEIIVFSVQIKLNSTTEWTRNHLMWTSWIYIGTKQQTMKVFLYQKIK